MSCNTAQAWEPQSSGSNAWITRERTGLDWSKSCAFPSYYHTDAAPKTWSYLIPHRDPLTQPNAYYRFPMYGSNYIYRQWGNFYSTATGACLSNDQCIDSLSADSCLGRPFYAGVKCSELPALGYPTSSARTFADGTSPQQTDFQPWSQLNETYDTLLENWRYNRPGYNS